jgi:hypothetical protein
LIKDYEWEVHYHPGKANIIADVLSHKAHCNYLPVVRLTVEESSTRVLPNLSLVTLTKAWIILREESKKVTRMSLVSVRMRKEPCEAGSA